MAAIKKLCKPYGLHSFCFTRYKIAYYGEKIKLNPGQLKPEFMQDLMSKNLFPPDDYFLKSIAESRGLSYTIGKQGYSRFLSDNNKPIYPMADGFCGSPSTETLKAGSVIIDRFGKDTGNFVSPKGTTFAERSLPKESESAEYHIYRVTKDIPNVLSGRTAPWFEQPGGGWQYKLPDKIMNLGEYLKEVD